MKYATFDVADESGINLFLETHKKQIAADGIMTIPGGIFKSARICILYADEAPKIDPFEIRKEEARAATRKFIGQRLSELAGADLDERYFRGRELSGEPVAQQLNERRGHKKNLASQIKYAHMMLKEINDGTWAGLQDDPTAVYKDSAITPDDLPKEKVMSADD